MSGILARLGAQFLQNASTRTSLSVVAPCIPALQITREKSTKPKRRKVHPFHWWTRKNRPYSSEDNLTFKNQEFLKDQAKKIYLAPGESPLEDEPWPILPMEYRSRRTAIIARKLGSYPLWLKKGKRILTSVLQICDQNVIEYMPPDVLANTRLGYKYRGKYAAVIVGADAGNPNKYTEEYLQLFKKSGVAPMRKITRFLVSPEAALKPGTPLCSRHLRVGDYVSVFGKSIDKGWQGAVSRYGMKGGRATHGVTKNHKRGGATGGPRGRILKGRKMPGHHGSERRLSSGLKVVRLNHANGVAYIFGRVPGPIGAYVYIHDTKLNKKRHRLTNPPPFPTYMAKEGETLVDEEWSDEILKFDEPSIVYKEEVQVKRKLKVKAKQKAAGKR